MTLKSKDKSHILETYLQLILRTLSFHDWECSNMAQILPLVCRKTTQFQMTAMTLELKVKVNYFLKSVLQLFFIF